MRGEILLFLTLVLLSPGILSTRINVNSNFWLDYEFPDDKTIRITMTAKNQGWVGLGFGTVMANSDMIMGRMVNGQAEL